MREPLCLDANASAPSTGPGAPRNPVAQSDAEAGLANGRARYDATQGPTGTLTVGPSAGTHRTSRSGPRARRAAPSAITPLRGHGDSRARLFTQGVT